jgi:diguanylate cyclase (GGDEF)-like protein
MPARPDDRLPAALLRTLEVRLAAPAIGVFAWRPGGVRMAAGTPALAALSDGEAAGRWRPPPPGLAPALEGGGAARLDPAGLGLAGGFAAAAPVRAPAGGLLGFLLMLDRRRRRLTPALAAALGDGAELAAPVLLGERALPRHVHSGASGRGPVRPRVAAARMVEAALRAGGPEFALVMLDLDRFRAINEGLGTAAGDALLAITGARLEHALGPADRLLRLEGDRFVILAARADLRGFARRLLSVVSQPLDLAGRTVVVQASMGIVAGLPADLPTATLLMRADAALRQAKAEGRNRYVLHEPRLEAATLERSRLELDLAGAPANGQMHLVYQPYVELAGGAVSGAEALLRWRHPGRGELPPAAFIPLAEATGLILPIGAWALRTALAQAARWPAPVALSVNISAMQFHQPGFTSQVDAALAEAGFPAERLELEITETVLMRDNPATIGRLNMLIARGVRIALDDFGTGYSALAYLARLPHHRIKLDKAFVQDLGNPATAELIRAIIQLARAQGVAVTAEGVETPGLLAEVRRMGFTHAQGFATGAPVPDPGALLGAVAEAPAG